MLKFAYAAIAAVAILASSSCAIQSSPALAVDPAPPPPIVHVVPLAKTSRHVAAVPVPADKPTPAQNAAHVVDVIKAKLSPIPPLVAVDRAHVLDKIRTSAVNANEWREARVDGKWFIIAALLFVFVLAVLASLVDYFKHHHAASLPHVEIAPLLEKAKADADTMRAKLVAEAEDAHVGQTIAKAEEWLKDLQRGYDERAKQIVEKAEEEVVDAWQAATHYTPNQARAALGLSDLPVSVTPIEPSVAPVVVVEHVEPTTPTVVEAVQAGILPALTIKEARAKVNSLAYGTPEYEAAFKELQDITTDAVKKAS